MDIRIRSGPRGTFMGGIQQNQNFTIFSSEAEAQFTIANKTERDILKKDL